MTTGIGRSVMILRRKVSPSMRGEVPVARRSLIAAPMSGRIAGQHEMIHSADSGLHVAYAGRDTGTQHGDDDLVGAPGDIKFARQDLDHPAGRDRVVESALAAIVAGAGLQSETGRASRRCTFGCHASLR